MSAPNFAEKLSPKDFVSDQEVRWCPGCGDYSILKATERALSEVGASKENTVFVSGIGCSSRFPYYLNTYGFHTIHGRAPAVATGVKLANPDLDVWVVTGDGDALSIGGNHILHVLRRNVDLQILLLNNEIYALTKGQYSPTSRAGTRSPSTPMGSLENPIAAARFALGSGARFVARSVETHQGRLLDMMKRAYHHKGTSFLEIYQNCVVYSEGVFADFTAKDVEDDRQIHVEHGKPMIFGRDRDRGIRIKPGTLVPEVVTIGEEGVKESDLIVHDETNRALAMMLATMSRADMPVALGVLYCDPNPCYEERVTGQLYEATAAHIKDDLNSLLRRGHTWEVE
ncbi:MAG: 2-oxoacid:ferredoxin oxidoreductase subunit beta [Rhodospirillales bacterium]